MAARLSLSARFWIIVGVVISIMIPLCFGAPRERSEPSRPPATQTGR